MNLLIAGGGKGGWQVRGCQLGAALGATVEARPTISQWRRTDVGVLVKHSALSFRKANACGARLIWDVLDVWRQPDDNALSLSTHIQRIHEVRDELGVSVLIAATQQMAEDIGGVYVPHHSRPGLTPQPIRHEAAVVAYEGKAKYLGPWRKALEIACVRLGLEFVVNPENLSDADIVVAFRGGMWDGEVCRRWKSGVKYVNAIAAGRPVLTQACAAFAEIQPPGHAVEQAEELIPALRALMPADVRQQALEACQQRAPQFALDRIARQYRDVLVQSVRRAA